MESEKMSIKSFFGIGRGKTRIELEKTSFSAGETITGKLVIDIKKEVPTNYCDIKLYATQKQKTVIAGKKSYETVTIYEDKVRIAESRNYPQGFHVVNFEVKVPANVESDLMKSGFGQVIKTLGQVTGFAGKIKWFIKGHVDVPKAFDMRTKKIRLTVTNSSSKQIMN